LTGLLFEGVLAGLRESVGTCCGGAGNLCTSRELVDSVELRFLDRVGAISCGYYGVVGRIFEVTS
jgi:hypothetical protein